MGSEKLLILRAKCIQFFKGYEKWLIAMVKYLGVVWLLALISNKIGYVEVLTRSYVLLGIGFLSMLLPVQYVMILIFATITAHLLAYNVLLGGIVGTIFMVVYLGYIRLYPKESMLIILTIVAFALNFQYSVPIIAALFGSYACLVAILIGIVGVYGQVALSGMLQNMTESLGFAGMIEQTMDRMVSMILVNPHMVSMLIVFSIVFSIVYFIRKQSIDYAPYIAIAVGGVMNLLGVGFAILFLKIEVNVLVLVIMTFLSVLAAIIVQVFALPLDYTGTETVQFEDESNIYYVKVVPKISVHLEAKKVEQIYTMNNLEEEEIL